MVVPRKVKHTITLWSNKLLLLSIYPNEFKVGTQTDIQTLMFIAILFTIAKSWKQLRWMDIQNVTHMQTMDYSAL